MTRDPTARADVELVNCSRLEAAHARAGELVDRQRRLNDQLDAYFREVAEIRETLRDEGSLWEGPRLDPPIEAAYHAWAAHGPVEIRVNLENIGPLPLMPLEPPPRRAPDDVLTSEYGWPRE